MDEMPLQVPELLAVDLDRGFAELVRSHGGVVYSVLLRLSGSSRDVEDLVQDTFLRAYTALSGYAPERRGALQPRAWLLAIGTNVWRNHVRTLTRRPVAESGVDVGELPLADGGPGPEQRAEHVAEREGLVAALAELPERYRVPVVLRHIAELGYAEIAELLGCPVGTVKAQVSRGLAALREMPRLTQEEVIR
ncbi:RNA polymerase sigma-70 factor (ECF subfamily) [Streptomyces cavourensis]|uniref:RNA polymerase sigma factor n=2 Tax=Streptomyces TaxID=1883 RepID=UPI00116BA2E6|nr:RNA polymerase sigma factor [Streptomyces cavourensis]MBH0243359.1 RNA polymerase sigma factor [Streptomyces cavourensis]TQO32076.1 RNA polymerase sigma-70 factor (ECF subfamily) [Streptomyces cavourensis]